MKALSPDNTTHEISLIPRFYPAGAVVFSITKEGYNVTETVANSYSITNGVMTVTVDYTVTEGDRYSIKITEGSNVVYRGNIISTEQETQSYTQNYLVYEF